MDKDKLIFKTNRPYLSARDGKLFFIAQADKGFTSGSSDVLINKAKLLSKKIPWFFSFIYYAIGASFVGRSARSAIKDIDEGKIVINLGSGIKRIRPDVINIDFYPFPNVDIVADISDLPLVDSSVDAVINEYVLEHVPNPGAIVQEMRRVLKSGGLIYVAVPFVASFHSSPNDYYRWSQSGLRELLKDFKEIEIGVRCGPTSAMTYIISEWLSTILSFGVTLTHQFWFMLFMILLSPFKVFDYLIYKLPGSANIAYGFYFIGKKI